MYRSEEICCIFVPGSESQRLVLSPVPSESDRVWNNFDSMMACKAMAMSCMLLAFG